MIHETKLNSKAKMRLDSARKKPISKYIDIDELDRIQKK